MTKQERVKKDDTGKQILARLKTWLLLGKTITPNQALMLWRTSRIAVYVHRLRRDYRMKIETKMVNHNGDTFACYSLVKTKKRKVKFN